LTWDVFLPCLEKFNAKRVQLIKTMSLLLDETMAMWVPKSNGVEVTTYIIVYQSVVQHAEVTKGLEYFGDQTSLPNNESIIAHTS
jgi:hypothetical protein